MRNEVNTIAELTLTFGASGCLIIYKHRLILAVEAGYNTSFIINGGRVDEGGAEREFGCVCVRVCDAKKL